MNRALISAAAIGLLLAAAPTARGQGSLMDLGKGLLQNQIAPSAAPGGQRGAGLSTDDIGAGLKEALKVAADHVTGRLGSVDGFNGDPSIHIPLPNSLATAQKALRMAGQSALLDDLDLKLNRAAEAATPQAKQIFWDALSRMSLDDARAILSGPPDAATQYFKRTMSPDLKTAMRPVVDKTVADSGAMRAYQGVVGAAGSMPVVGQMAQSGPTMLTNHVLDYALAGIFKYLGQEEAAIRSDPAKQTTDLLRKVFGS